MAKAPDTQRERWQRNGRAQVTSMRFRHILSLGAACEPAWHLRRHGMLRDRSPFDWLVTPIDSLLAVLADDGARLGRDLVMNVGTNSCRCAHYDVLYHHEIPRAPDGSLLFSVEALERCRSKLAHKMQQFIEVCERSEPVLFIRMEVPTGLPWDRQPGPRAMIDVVDAIAKRFPRLEFRVLLAGLQAAEVSIPRVDSVALAPVVGPSTWSASDEAWDALLGSIDYAPASGTDAPAHGEQLFGI